MNKELIERFLKEMREKHSEQIDAVALPDGTAEFIAEVVASHDNDTVEFMVKLSYLMGLQTGFAAAVSGASGPGPEPGRGPLQA